MTKRNPRRQYSLQESAFYRLGTKRDLCDLLQIEVADLKAMGIGASNYDQWTDRSRSKPRHIEHPKPALKRLHKRIASLLARVMPPAFLYCPVKGKSFIENAKLHASGKEIRTLDIEKYFPSTTRNRIVWFFSKVMKCAPDIAHALGDICTLDQHLPTGSPVSPILSFFAHLDMWERINIHVEQAGCVLSVYIDDISVSGVRVPDKLVWLIKREIRAIGLHYHKEKRFRGKAKTVTGVIVIDGLVKAPHRAHHKTHLSRVSLQSLTGEARADEQRRYDGRVSLVTQIAKAN